MSVGSTELIGSGGVVFTDPQAAAVEALRILRASVAAARQPVEAGSW